MSSILRALKKLENEPRHLQENQPLDGKFVPLADTSPKNARANIFVLIIGGGIVCGIVILAGWWLFREKTPLQPVGPQKISSQNATRPETAPVTPQKDEAQQHSSVPAASPDASAAVDKVVQKAAPDLVETPKPVADTHAAPQIPAETPGQAAAPLPPVQSQVPPGEKQTSAVEAAIREPLSPPVPETTLQAANEKVTAAGTNPPEVPVQVREAEIPLLNDPDIKLQAITWSKNPRKRLVVLNNHILRQGETANGYRIDIINQDDIVLSNGGEKWKLLFRIR